jgi:hypothetical protein
MTGASLDSVLDITIVTVFSHQLLIKILARDELTYGGAQQVGGVMQG